MKKLLALMLSLLLIISTCSAVVFAEGIAVANVDGAEYTDLQAAFDAVTDDGKITLLNDVTIADEVILPADKSYTLDLNGKTITSTEDSANDDGAVVLVVLGNATIKNGNIVASNGVGGILFSGGSSVIENVKVTVTGVNADYEWFASAIQTANGAILTVNSGSYSSDSSGLIMKATGGTVTVEGGTFTTTGSASTSAAIRIDGWSQNNTCIINDGTFNAENTNTYAFMSGGMVNQVNINGGVFNGQIDAQYKEITINGGTFNSKLIQSGGHQNKYIINGGNFVEDVTDYVTAGSVITVSGTKYIKNEDGTIEEFIGLVGKGTEESPYLINNLADLKWFRDDVNVGNNYKQKYVKLTANIDLADIDNWTPIGNSTNQFNGHFDGGNNTVSNLKINNMSSYIGFFGYTAGGSVKNITLHNVDIDGRLGVGALAGSPYTSDFDNIKLTGLVTIDAKFYVGGLFGRSAYGDLTNITVAVDEGSYVKADSVENGIAYRTYVGGVVGFMGEGSQAVKNVTSNINVIGSTIDVGGIAGIAHYNNTFENVTCTGNVTLENADSLDDAQEIGGIAGVWHNETGTTTTFIDCSYTGVLSSTYTDSETNTTITLTNDDFANGGIVGAAYNTTGEGIASINGVTVMAVLPTATVTDIDLETLENVESGAPELTFAKKFVADSVSDTVFNFYKDWYADFVLTINKQVTFEYNSDTADGYLAGQYDAWSENWIGVPFDAVTLEANQPLKIMEYATSLMGQSGLKVTYNDVLNGVVEFDCGVFFTEEFMAANPDLEVTLELCIFNPENEAESYVIHEAESFTLGVATVNGYNYDTFGEAIAAANAIDNAKIVLLQNIALDTTAKIIEGANVTLDLNSHKITVSYNETTGRSLYAIDNYGTFTLTDSATGGTIIARGVQNFGTMTMAGGTIVSCDKNGGAAIWNEGVLEMTGGTLKATHQGTSSDQNGPGALNNAGGNVTIKGGVLDSVNLRTYALISSGTLNILGDDVIINSGHGAIAVNNGTALIEGGSFNTKYSIGQSDHALYASSGTVTVEGGTFDGRCYGICVSGGSVTVNDGSFTAEYQSVNVSDGTLVLNAGTYSDENGSDYVKEGFEFTENENGTYSIVEKTEETLNTGILYSKGYVPSNYNGWGKAPYSILFAVGIDSLDYSVGGFEITINDVTKNFTIDGTVWSSLTITDSNTGEKKTWLPSDFGEGNNYIMYYIVTFDDEMVQANPDITVRAFLKEKGGSEFIYSKTGIITLV